MAIEQKETRKEPESNRPDSVTLMLCPICKVALTMSDRQGGEIDYCPQCRGVWLDRGELDKIIERSAAEMASTRPPLPSQQRDFDDRNDRGRGGHSKHGGSHGGYRRKSWLHEIFD